MKKQNQISKKLTLKKLTISKLNHQEINLIKGGNFTLQQTSNPIILTNITIIPTHDTTNDGSNGQIMTGSGDNQND